MNTVGHEPGAYAMTQEKDLLFVGCSHRYGSRNGLFHASKTDLACDFDTDGIGILPPFSKRGSKYDNHP